MTLHDLFNLSFVGRKGSVAIEFGSTELTFGELDSRSNALGRDLLNRGLKAGDRLCVYMGNSLEIVELFLACIKTGIIFVPINILYRQRETEHILHDAEPKAVVTAGSFPSVCPQGIAFWNVGQLATSAAHVGDQPLNASIDGDSPAAIVYTSGTTGTSKGAVLTHNNFMANALNLVACWQITERDRLLLPLPLFHVHGLGNGLVCCLAAGCRLHLLGRFDQAKIADAFRGFAPTLFFGVPTIYVKLLSLSKSEIDGMADATRLFVSGSAPLPSHVLHAFQQRFGKIILERYGMTETLMNLSNPYFGERRAGTVGLPLPGISVRLLDNARQPVSTGEIGELYIKGPNVFAGYWRQEEATEEAFVNSYFRTGDLAVCSQDGYYTLRGRRSDLIISSGFNIYPREVEEFLMEQPEILEAVVVGIPDHIRGELPVAYVVPKGAFDPTAMEGRCRAALASFKTPKAFIVMEQLPRTALGKIQRHLLPTPPGLHE